MVEESSHDKVNDCLIAQSMVSNNMIQNSTG